MECSADGSIIQASSEGSVILVRGLPPQMKAWKSDIGCACYIHSPPWPHSLSTNVPACCLASRCISVWHNDTNSAASLCIPGTHRILYTTESHVNCSKWTTMFRPIPKSCNSLCRLTYRLTFPSVAALYVYYYSTPKHKSVVFHQNAETFPLFDEEFFWLWTLNFQWPPEIYPQGWRQYTNNSISFHTPHHANSHFLLLLSRNEDCGWQTDTKMIN